MNSENAHLVLGRVLLNPHSPIRIENEEDTESNVYYQAEQFLGKGSFGTVFKAKVFLNGELAK